MNTYVAFLRGINVGGKNIIAMSDLKSAFKSMGFISVRTYINSGNVIFQSSETSRPVLESRIMKSLGEKLGYSSKVLVRSEQDIEATISNFPAIFQDSDWKHNIIFLGNSIDSPELLEKFVLKVDIEQNSYAPGVLFWSALWKFGTRSTMMKLSKSSEYQEMTVRSIGTVTKIRALMKR